MTNTVRKYLMLLLMFPLQLIGQGEECRFIKKTIKDTVYYGIGSNSVSPISIIISPVNEDVTGMSYKKEFVIKSNDSIEGAIRIHSNVADTLPLDKIVKQFDIKLFYGDKKHSKHNADYLYTLPFKKGKRYEVTQGFYGKRSHNSIASRYAIDFNLKIGELVCAAREGVVVYTIDHFKEAGGKAFTYKANKILIMHDDGTFASYAHLNYKGVLVKKGDYVKSGQPIGYSGNTGNSRGPHLHFVVREADDVSVPVYFKGYKDKTLKRGKRYKR
ncbi:peptidoglycan DD-metalloendopeptidase family protein [Flavobacteriaceae bacterium R38]|nr:peptidoglycan DD-metalloendopeptidase family protein [Flavobacteriaceae bacterium R38]